MNYLDQDVKYLKGVGPVRADLLRKELQVSTIRDLLYVFPYKYIDRSVVHKIRDLQEGMPYVQLRGQIVDFELEGAGRKRRLKAVFSDGTGFVELVWFNSISMVEKSLKISKTYLLLGKPVSWNGRFSMAHPEMEVVENSGHQPQKMQPHYHLTEKMKRSGVNSRMISDWVNNALSNLKTPMSESLPPYFCERYGLLPLDTAIRTLHHPAKASDMPEATRRVKFEELFYLQLEILRYSKLRKQRNSGFYFPKIAKTFHEFYSNHLPFALTQAQQRVLREIRADVATGKQMNRLLQGDVGSGKTLVALMCCLIAVDNGFQTCLMAPTEILAEQHLQTLRDFLGDMPVKVELLTGNVTGKQRREILARIAEGDVDILVGTHALIEPTVVFKNLGLAVIDEQHRFGVKQRARLWEKNVCPPHVLVMTATPIPRTLAMTVYGDLDVSVIDELPPGRKPVQTLHYMSEDRPKLFQGLRQQLALGRQAYVVFPLIAESESLDLKNLEEGYSQLCDAFPEYEVGQVHGRMKPIDKDAAMQAFSSGKTRILVSTTVIEVGVNVPNSTVMVIEDADRFGLSQLHQLRGRVGRGGDQSYCILVTKSKLSDSTRRRMQIMTETTDGFEIAEEDLKLRGPGDLEGTAQSGLPFKLKMAHVIRDADLMEEARDAAAELLRQDSQEELPQNAIIWKNLKMMSRRNEDFSDIS